jgi:hypothetical protein
MLRFLQPPAPFIMNQAEPRDFPLGRWNLYIGGAGRTGPTAAMLVFSIEFVKLLLPFWTWRALASCYFTIRPPAASATTATCGYASRRRSGILAGAMLTEHPLLNAVIFASLGIAVFAVAAAILLRVTPLKLWRELVEERNVAVAIFAGATAIGICLIIAAAMH